MLKNIRKVITENDLLFDIINVVLGIGVVILIVMAYMQPSNKLVYGAAFSLGGLLNISNGFKLYRKKKTKSTGTSLIMIGAIILALGVYTVGSITR